MVSGVFNPSFYRFSPRVSPESFTILQSFGNHTVAWLDYPIRTRPEYLLPSEDLPMSVRWGSQGGTPRTFYGYVNHYETTSEFDSDTYLRLVALGTSKVMNTANPIVWSESTRSAIVRDYARKYKLRSITHLHPYVEPVWSSGTASVLESLRRAADESGYRVWVDGATVSFLDPQRLLSSPQSMDVPFFGASGALRMLKVTGGSNAPRDRGSIKRQTVYGMDNTTNEVFEATGGSPAASNEVLSNSATSYTEADRATDAVERRSQDYYMAKMTVDGDARVVPGSLIRLGGSQVTNDQEGYWFVESTRHEVNPEDYVTHLTATRSAIRRALSSVPSTLRGAREVSDCVVRDGHTWEAVLQEHVNA